MLAAQVGSYHTYDPFFSSNGFQFQASQLGRVESDWITGVSLVRLLEVLVRRKLLHAEDCEVLKMSLVPVERRDPHNEETIYVLLDGLVREGLVSSSFATKLRSLTLAMHEFLGGSADPGKPKRQQPPFHRIIFFHIPQHTSMARITALEHLIEAAVYPVPPSSIWKGVYYADDSGKLLDYYNAYACTYHARISTPPHLTDYNRTFTFLEQRMLLRAKLLLDLQTRVNSHSITDFGLFKTIRGSYFYLSRQPHLDVEELGRFLYAR
ncbi:hypothetical protein K458DRAFT_202383 [Lentithecium fluviatile CBS 122367]|uniref:Uncharacterized protein n=1 Tax=Lentithecium fluviatile CBS 122367 TaxID=1168545 RepID=A0A6G1J897_9PLEO|nr:hypothetical protein K458DRAFT_202383 [Lentithecium fluviatile CBS 122367]